MVSSTNRVLFFIVLGFAFAIFFTATNYFYSITSPSSSFKRGGIIIVSSIIFSLFFLGYTTITKLLKEGYNFCPSPGAKLCRGGPYMWQGDSERAKYCRALTETEEGAVQINRHSCGSGYTGMPGGGFNYTTINKRCDSPVLENNGIF
jgi:hypothetical protein